jgi:RNA polymerase sigma-70 factor, ECF subfamily
MLVDLSLDKHFEPRTIIHKNPYDMPDVESDLALVRRMAGGDNTALHELYAAYGQRLCAYALRLTGDQAQAEDVVQDALVAAWKSARKFRGEGRPIAWLLGIVHHLAMKSLRHRSQLLTDEVAESLVGEFDSPEQEFENVEQIARVRAGLQTLSPEHRAVLELIFYQNLSLDEAARVCDVPLGTIKSRLSYARRYLRGILSRQGMEEFR